MVTPVFNPAVRENQIRARFDDATLDKILAQCRRRNLRRAELVRRIVEDWLDEQERKATSDAA